MAAPTEGQPQQSPRRIPIWFIVLVVVMVGMILFGDRGLLRVFQSQQQLAEMGAQIAALEATNADLRKKIEALQSDLGTIENIARRELGMVRPDELVYQFPPDRTAAVVPPAATNDSEAASPLDSATGER